MITEINIASLNDVPLIFTSKGNLPVDALRYENSWIVQESYIIFNEKWLLDDELVKSNSHCYTQNPLGQATSEQQAF
ncbi:hypothetical protein UFOVP84_31 [uncultured Caudovirales phage]|uniref:Uncharacterized protein n=1 Tax=uncultured Caudovirales phage TaxID=2100421 RepID=A0A6J5L0U8_9CAUD|nr:hypothetical protein UFOVP84_31 [uncultured Caudovirales phage]